MAALVPTAGENYGNRQTSVCAGADRQTPEALGALQKADIEKWWPIIKAANIKGE